MGASVWRVGRTADVWKIRESCNVRKRISGNEEETNQGGRSLILSFCGTDPTALEGCRGMSPRLRAHCNM